MAGMMDVVVIAAALMVAVVLVIGVVGFARGASPQRSQRLMWLRIGAQGAVLLLFLVLLLMRG